MISAAFRKNIFPATSQEEGNRTLALMCAMDMRPLSIAEGEGFRLFVNTIAPLYKIPCRRTVVGHLTTMYESEKSALVKEIREAGGNLSITSDLWTSAAHEGYITITGHFIDQNWEMKNHVLATRRITERHTALNIASELSAIAVEEYGATITCIVTDNAANIRLAAEENKWSQASCFAHTLQLCIEDGLKIDLVSRSLAAARRLVAHFSHSVLATDALKARQRAEGVAVPLKLIQATPTRWNSSLEMVERLILLRIPVYAVLCDDKITKPRDRGSLDISDQFWRVMEDILPVLRPLADATEILGKESVPTGSSVPILIQGLLKSILVTSDMDSKIVAQLKGKIAAGMMKRMHVSDCGEPDEILLDTLPLMATLLDTRYKGLLLGLMGASKMKKLQKNVASAADNLEASQATSTDASVVVKKEKQDDKHPGQAASTRSIFQMIEGEVLDLTTTDADTAQEEVDEYLAAPVRVKCPLAWWREHGYKFSRLSRLAHMYLAVPASSVPSERAFSTAGLTVTKLRASLDPSTADKLIFLNKRMRSRKSSATQVPQVPAQPAVTTSVKREPEEAQGGPVVPQVTGPNHDMPPLPTINFWFFDSGWHRFFAKNFSGISDSPKSFTCMRFMISQLDNR